jgi:hypothetical protein
MFEAKALLGGALLGQKKYAEAEPLLLAGYRGMSGRAVRMPPAAEGPGRLHEVLDWLIELAEARADKDAAARWRKERGAGGRDSSPASHGRPLPSSLVDPPPISDPLQNASA